MNADRFDAACIALGLIRTESGWSMPGLRDSRFIVRMEDRKITFFHEKYNGKPATMQLRGDAARQMSCFTTGAMPAKYQKIADAVLKAAGISYAHRGL